MSLSSIFNRKKGTKSQTNELLTRNMQLAASFITCIGNYFSAELPEIAIHDGD
jgi:hypothetical protein